MKRKPPLLDCPFHGFFFVLFRIFPWPRGTVSQHHCIQDMLPMKIYPYLSDRRETNETDVKYVETCNLQNVWDSSDSLNGNSCLL